MTNLKPRTSGRATIRTMLVLALAATVGSAMAAGLPSAMAPAGVASGDYPGLMQALLRLGYNVMVLFVGAWAFWKVAGGGLTKWGEYQKGRIELADLKEYFIGGTVVLAVIVALLTVGNTIL